MSYFVAGVLLGVVGTVLLAGLVLWLAVRPPTIRPGRRYPPEPMVLTPDQIARFRLRGVDLADTPDGRDRPSPPPRSA